jgi:hypothetical protein
VSFAGGRKPDFKLRIKQRDGDYSTTAGVGWENRDGSISIMLNPCVVLSHADNVFIGLFRIEERSKT